VCGVQRITVASLIIANKKKKRKCENIVHQQMNENGMTSTGYLSVYANQYNYHSRLEA
jgi:hypothetical protein